MHPPAPDPGAPPGAPAPPAQRAPSALSTPSPPRSPAPVGTGALPRAAAFLVCVVLTAAMIGLYLWAVRTADGQAADVRLFAVLQNLNPTLGPLATTLRPVLGVAAALACAVLGIFALIGRRWRALAAAVLVVVVAVVATQALKNVVLDRPYLGDHGYTTNTFPSGHVSATLALVAAAALLSPAWRTRTARRVFLLTLAAVAAAACLASLLEHVHRPSDVVGSVLLVGSATALAIAVFRPPLPRLPGAPD